MPAIDPPAAPPCMEPWFMLSMPPMPMSFMVAIGRGRSGGTGAVMPSRGAKVMRAIPERSTLSPTSVNARSSVGLTIASSIVEANGGKIPGVADGG